MITGADLRRAREEAGVGLDRMSRMIGKSKGHLSQVERGLRDINGLLVRGYEQALERKIAQDGDDSRVGLLVGTLSTSSSANAGAPEGGLRRSRTREWNDLSPASLLTPALHALRELGTDRKAQQVVTVPAGRFFDGQPVDVRVYPAVDDGRVLTAVPADFAASQFLRRARRGLVIGIVEDDDGERGFGVDSRYARRRLARAAPGSRLAIPSAYALDDLTIGLLWALVNLDGPLLDDDGLLTDAQQHLPQYEAMASSSAGRDLAGDLTSVSQMWLGSDFCARHILRHLPYLSSVPDFWTREQRGEEASTWLLFRHKYDYLQAISDRFAGEALSRAFCIPPGTASHSPRAERVLLLLAAALMESFNIRVEVCAEPEYAAVEGFVLDCGRQAIVANWVGASGIWHVGITGDRPAIHDYDEVVGYSAAHSAIAGRSPADRLRTLADYLELDWLWLVRRCTRLGERGCAGFAEPRSRLLSVAGVDRACQYVAQVGSATG